MTSEPLFRLRVRYIETGRLRFLSHLELMRALERIIRRSGIPYAITQGFSPHIKAAYCPALPVGVASTDEWFDLWVRRYRPAAEYLEALSHAAPDDLVSQEAAYIDVHAPSLSAALTLSTWEIEIIPSTADDMSSQAAITATNLETALAQVCEAGEITYLRAGTSRTVSLEGKFATRPIVTERPEGLPGVHITLTTRASNTGALRPDILMGAVLRQLTESSTAQRESGAIGRVSGVSCIAGSGKPCISIVRAAQFLEGKDGSWVRPI